MKQIQVWLGHSTFAITADIYFHLDFSAQMESGQVRGRYIVMKTDLADSYLRAVREDRNCYRRFHREMAGRYFVMKEQEEAEEIACGMKMQG